MTPADRLARSRLAIIEHLQRRENRREGRHAHEEATEESGDGEPEQDEGSSRGGWFHGLSGAARSWWRHHPFQLAVEMTRPMLQSYLRRKPFTVLGISAAVGVALVVTRPWRVISVTTLLIAVVKSSQLTGAVMSALTSAQDWQPQAPSRKPRQDPTQPG